MATSGDREPLLSNQSSGISISKYKSVSTLQLFRFSSAFDRTLITIGSAFAIVSGISKPIFAGILGNVSQSFINFTNEIEHLNATDPRREELFEAFHHEVSFLSLLYFILATGAFICSAIQETFFIIASENMISRIRKLVMASILRQEVAWFDSQKSGSLANNIFNNIERIKEGTGNYFGMTIQAISMFISGYAICFYYNWKLSLIGTSLTPFMGLWGYWTSKKMAQLARGQEEKNSEAGGVAQQALSAMKTVMYFNGQEEECERYKSILELVKSRGIRYARWNGAFMAMSVFLLHASYCITIWIGTNLVYDGSLKPGVVITVFITIMLCIGQLDLVVPLLTKISRAKVEAEPVYAILDRQPEINYSDVNGKRPDGEGTIVLSNVNFHYPTRPDVQILRNVNLEIESGKTVALVGSSGSGKSTLVQLLLRFYDPFSGQIKIDGEDIAEWNINHLRNIIGVVSQEPQLFDTTIEENIRYGRENVSEKDIWKALKQANAEDFVKAFPRGLKTLVGDKGAQLSGGQKQRIAIARALIRDPKILLLDEATSALDAQSETLVQKALENASKGRTTIIIAHRLSTIRNADKIIVIKNGEITEMGTHNELVDKKGLYFDLVNNQVFVEATEQVPREVTRLSQSISSEINPLEFLRQLSAFSEQPQVEEVPIIVEDLTMKRLKSELNNEEAEESSFLRIFKETGSDWKHLVTAAFASSCAGAVYPAFSFGFTEVIKIFSNANKDKMLEMGHLFSFFFLGIGLFYAITELVNISLFGIVAERLSFKLRTKLYRNFMRQDASYYDKPSHAPGRLLTRLATDVNNIKPAVSGRLGLTLTLVTTDIIAYSLAIYFGWQMAIVAIPIFSPIYIVFAAKSRFLKRKVLQDEKEMESCGKIAMEAIENIRTVKSLTLEHKIYENYSHHLLKPITNGRQRAIVQGLSYGLTNAIHFFLYSICFQAGLFIIYHRYLEPQYMLKSMFMVTFTSFSLGGINGYLPEYIKAKMAAGLLFKMMDYTPQIDNLSSADIKPEIRGNVYIKQIKFSYPERKDVEVLKELEIELKEGQTIALVGASGCGKSTVISLLERFYDPLEGTIEIDGHDISKINPRHLRENISIVSQEPILFDMSIKENILYGLKEFSVSHQEMVEAAKKANIHEFISSLPLAYQTRVGDKGTQLSGGQKQRIAIARALVRNPKILLLDEATSALDTESEKHVQQALEEASQGRSCLVVAHRLSTIRKADQILVFSGGRIVEKGNHEELMSKKGEYFKLVQKQSHSY